MYEEFYSLTNDPFNLTPDPEFLYLSKKHAGALEHLLYGIERKRGLIVLTGESGTGKTTLLHAVVQRLDDTTHTAFVVHPEIVPLDIYKYVCYEFGVPIDVSGKTKSDLVIALKDFLIQCANRGENCVLIVDEAQNLSQDVLEEIRLLLNFETNEKKFLQIVLAGHTELHDTLNLVESARLKQRISVVYNLLPLDHTETTGYLERRLMVARARQPIFTADAIAEIARCSRGIPHLINVVCDSALFMGFGRKQRTIDRDVILQVEQMLQYLQESDASTASSSGPARERETAVPVAPQAAEYRPLSDVLTQAERPAYHEVLVRRLSPPAATTPTQLRAQVKTPESDARRQATAATTRAQRRAKRRGFWWSLLGGIAAGIILSLVTWGGFVPQPERLPQGIAQFVQRLLAALPSSPQHTTRPLADTPRISHRPGEPPGPSQATPSMQTATVPIAPLTENRTELGTDLQTTRRLGSLSAEDMPAPVKHMRLQGTLPISPTAAPSETVPPQVPLPTPRVIVVQAGDTLGEIILRTYKRLNNQLLTMVREANPGITTPSRLEVGQRIVLPAVQ